ncbi:MAG: tRNA (adenosine(37)-N6)-threonylcarbamoyltransferase complex dimerization subunit type 1 TsaB [Oscillospiraceae bacterium]|nr:tRNA (adenosine(37)-N6)-threonylcarbamoyltransferase complex dimerization subunit type 1 TsaB [Oscillospiraceae bacterium]
MLILGLDSSAKAASCAVYGTDEKKIIAYGGVNVQITHSETLLPLVQSILKAANLTLNDIDAFAVSNGPGSFTGVRIAVSAVKGMAFTLDKPIYAVSTLRSLAFNLAGYDCIACCLMDARREQFYSALFDISDGNVTRLTEDAALSRFEIESMLEKYKTRKTILVGDGAELFYNNTGIKDFLTTAPQQHIHQNAVSVCLAGQEENPVSAKTLMPFYLRLAQAERERLKVDS